MNAETARIMRRHCEKAAARFLERARGRIRAALWASRSGDARAAFAHRAEARRLLQARRYLLRASVAPAAEAMMQGDFRDYLVMLSLTRKGD